MLLLPALALAMAITAGCGSSSTTPQFSRMTFMSTRGATPATNMFSSKLDGSDVTPIPFSSTNVYFVSSSADSKTVVFMSATRDIWVENSDGSGQTQLTTSGHIQWSRISPNGKKIVYDDYSTNHVGVMNIDGTGIVDLTPTLPTGMSYCYYGSFSADSLQIVFVCSGNPGTGIYTIKPDGTGIATVQVRTSGGAQFPFFTPDGKQIVFVGSFTAANSPANVPTTSGVGSVNIDGTSEKLLVANMYELVVLNSNLYYLNPCSGTAQIIKSNLDGSNPVTLSTTTNTDDLYYAFGGC